MKIAVFSLDQHTGVAEDKLVRSMGPQASLARIRERSAASTTGPSRMAFPHVAAQASAENSTEGVSMEAGAGNSYSK